MEAGPACEGNPAWLPGLLAWVEAEQRRAASSSFADDTQSPYFAAVAASAVGRVPVWTPASPDYPLSSDEAGVHGEPGSAESGCTVALLPTDTVAATHGAGVGYTARHDSRGPFEVQRRQRAPEEFKPDGRTCPGMYSKTTVSCDQSFELICTSGLSHRPTTAGVTGCPATAAPDTTHRELLQRADTAVVYQKDGSCYFVDDGHFAHLVFASGFTNGDECDANITVSRNGSRFKLAGQIPGDGSVVLRTRSHTPRRACQLVIGQHNVFVDEYIKNVGVDPAGFMSYTSISRGEGLEHPEPPPEPESGSCVQAGALPLHATQASLYTTSFPGAILQLGLWLKGRAYVEAVLCGDHDVSLGEIAKFMKHSGARVLLRIGYEFDHGCDAGPDLFKSAWVRIATLLRRHGAENVELVWHSFASRSHVDKEYDAPAASNIDRWWPGDDYVHWVGVSVFGHCFGDKSAGSGDAGMRTVARFAQRKHKPLMIAEGTPRGIGHAPEQKFEAWLQDTLGFIDEYDVRVFCFISENWDAIPRFKGQKWGDTRVHEPSAVEERRGQRLELWTQEVVGVLRQRNDCR